MYALFNARFFNTFKDTLSPSLVRTFGLFGLINFPLLYLLGATHLDEKPSALYLRLIGFFCCVPLALIDFWPKKLKPYQIHYWFVSVVYVLPFFGTYMFIENEASLAWQVKITVGIFWLVLITSWVQFLVILPLGVALALIILLIQYGTIHFDFQDNWGDLLNCGWAIVIASIFARRKEVIQQEKQRTLQMQAGAIAHEMRTPLFSLSGLGLFLKRIIPALINDHNALNPDQRDETFNDKQIAQALKAPEFIEKVTRQAFSFIDIMLMNLREDFRDAAIETCSIKKCVEEALTEYPFGGEDRSMVSVQINADFEFKGNPLLIKHVFFNLLKNSVYYVKAANKGNITLRADIIKGINTLSFKDTGTGIAPDFLPYIFDKFYSNTKYGTGIGLAFCKSVMKSLGGDIRCTSHYGEYTEFILTFPSLKK